jgi:2-methylcitrate dehydratase PrpD
MGLKQFPCCGSAIPAVAMALQLRHEEPLQIAEIEKIEILPHKRRLPHTNNPDPQSPLAAKFSVQYAVCLALLKGAPKLNDFEGTAHFDPEVRKLMAKTIARAHPDMPDDSPEQFGAEVIITLQSGVQLSRRVNSLIGRGGDHPLSTHELWEKFSDCAQRSIDPVQIRPLFDALEALESVKDIRQISALMRAN